MAEIAERAYSDRKKAYVERLVNLFQTYKTILLVEANFVGSNQMQQVRVSLRQSPKAEILMGKNTMVRQVIRKHMKDEKPGLAKLLAKKLESKSYRYLYGNIGLVFTNDDPKAVRAKILENKVPAPAKVGNIAKVDVFVPAGPTSLDPGQTSFFQALNIPTKINRGAIEILSEVHLIKKGDKVGSSEVSLLSKLNIKPFSYGLNVLTVYEDDNEGTIYEADILDLSEEDLLKKFFGGVSTLTAISLALGYPTLPAVPHILANAFKKILAISLATEYSFKQADKFKEMLANPGAFAAAAAPAGNNAGPAASAAAPEPEAEEEDYGFGDMFG